MKMNCRSVSGALVAALLLESSLVLDARTLRASSSASESSSESSSSEPKNTVLTFTATLRLPLAATRKLLDRPETTCGVAARPKDREVGNINNWLFEVADAFDVPRADVTAQGLAVINGNTLMFTVYVLHPDGRLSAVSAQTLAGVDISDGALVPLKALSEVSFDGGNKRDLESNLFTDPPSDGLTAIPECDAVVSIQANIPVPGPARRHLSAAPTTDELNLLTPVIDDILDAFAQEAELPRSQVTAQGLDIENGGATFVIFAIGKTGEIEALEVEFELNMIDLAVDGLELGAPVRVTKSQAPVFDASETSQLSTNLATPVNPNVAAALEDVPAATVVPTLTYLAFEARAAVSITTGSRHLMGYSPGTDELADLTPYVNDVLADIAAETNFTRIDITAQALEIEDAGSITFVVFVRGEMYGSGAVEELQLAIENGEVALADAELGDPVQVSGTVVPRFDEEDITKLETNLGTAADASVLAALESYPAPDL